MNLQKGQIIDLDIKALAFGGAGIGKYEGLTVFVEGTLPGDRVEAAFTKIKPKFAEARLVKITEQSKDREKPRCPYFGKCGGCQLQHMPYQKQLQFKQQHVIDALERIGKIIKPPVEEIIGCPDSFYYRNKMEFSFGYDENMNFSIGLHLPGRRYDILDLKECYLQSELSVKIVNAVREFMAIRGVKPYKFSNGEGFLRSIFVREGKRTDEVMVNLCTSDDLPGDWDEILAEFVEMLTNISDKIISIYFTQIISRRGQPKQTKERLIYGKSTLSELMQLDNGDCLAFEILPQAFFQVNTLQAEILYSQIVKMALKNEHKVVLDLFCGTGTIGLFLTKHVEQVIGIELNEDACKMARDNAQKNKIFNADFFAADVSKVSKYVKSRPSLIVVDPPRAGLTQKIIKQISDFGTKQMIYVSCNPATLARDILWLKEFGFSLTVAQPVDMFPHTYHIENVCLLER